MNSTATKIVICGPTASGKSGLAFELAKKIDGVIINFDSQKIYRELPIISAQPSRENQRAVKHYLYGVISGKDQFNVAIWLAMMQEIVDKIPAQQSIIFVGGSGLYLNALLNGLSPIPLISNEIRNLVRNMSLDEVILQLGEAKITHRNDHRMRRRLEVKLATGKSIEEFHDGSYNELTTGKYKIFNLNVPRETTYASIDKRFDFMLSNGGMDEVKNLHSNKSYDLNLPIMKACGVPQIISYLDGLESYQAAVSKAKQSTRNYAKRQMTWFRHQLPAHKIDLHEVSVNLILKELKGCNL